MRLPVGSVLEHHALCGGSLDFPITIIVISIDRFRFDSDEFLPATFRLLYLVCLELLEEIHDTGHSLRVGLRIFDRGVRSRLESSKIRLLTEM
jgi:hypothetical protein